MAQKLKGRPVVKRIQERIRRQIKLLNYYSQHPKLRMIRIGNREDDLSYQKSIIKNCDDLGIAWDVIELDANVTEKKLIETISIANIDSNVHGVLLFRPIPEYMNIERVRKSILPEKDVDSMTPTNLGYMFEGRKKSFVPCTAKAAVELLDYYDIPIYSANVTVIGSSLVVGRPLTLMLLDKGATVTNCHIATKDVSVFSKSSEIVIVAVGKANLFGENYFNEDSVVVDIGVNMDEDGNIVGDVNYDQVEPKVKAITPRRGGVGVITTTILLENVVIAAEHLMG